MNPILLIPMGFLLLGTSWVVRTRHPVLSDWLFAFGVLALGSGLTVWLAPLN